MGKYMRKAKVTGDIAVMEVSQPSLGVRTRAKTLALQRLQASAASRTTVPPPLSPPPTKSESESCYLQLRSRRLEKPPLTPKDSSKKIPGANTGPEHNSKASSNKLRVNSLNSGSVGSVSVSCSDKKDRCLGTDAIIAVDREGETEDNRDLGIEASFGENSLDFECRGRSTRESTPCSFIRDFDTIGTPGSTTRPTSAAATDRRIRSVFQRNIPTTHEMEEFFACAEQQQQRLFKEKYNFDVVNELPLTGRYEWVKVSPQA